MSGHQTLILIEIYKSCVKIKKLALGIEGIFLQKYLESPLNARKLLKFLRNFFKKYAIEIKIHKICNT
jgi:hypothetical protein